MANSVSNPTSAAIRNGSVAFVLICLIIGLEYCFRHYLMFLPPTIGTLRVNDMLSLVCAYSVLAGGVGLLMDVDWVGELSGVTMALRDCVTSRHYTGWIITSALSLGLLPVLDRVLWAGLHLPMLIGSYHNSIVWLPAAAPILKATTLILVNGLFVPVGEEFLWRGVVQPRLVRAMPVPLAIGITAVCFSLKHVLVDASFGRALTITALGMVFGVLAYRRNWWASAALHIFINTLSTVTALVLGRI